MPYQIDFDSMNRILGARFEGQVTDDDLKSGYRFDQENVTRFDPLFGITDFSGVTTVAFSAQTMRDLARTKPIMPNPSRPVVFGRTSEDWPKPAPDYDSDSSSFNRSSTSSAN